MSNAIEKLDKLHISSQFNRSGHEEWEEAIELAWPAIRKVLKAAETFDWRSSSYEEIKDTLAELDKHMEET